MDDLLYSSSIWLHQKIIDEMRQNLNNTLSELETLKMEANEKSRRHKEEVKQLLDLLKLTQQERDEAKQQLSHFISSRSIITESNSDGSSSSSSSTSPSSSDHMIDPLDVLVMGKAFPETGKLLKAVVDAGPLLQTLLVAGPLPKWVNPPPPQTQPLRFESPPLTPISFRGYEPCDSLTCSDSVMRFGFCSNPVTDQPMLTGKRQRLE